MGKNAHYLRRVLVYVQKGPTELIYFPTLNKQEITSRKHIKINDYPTSSIALAALDEAKWTWLASTDLMIWYVGCRKKRNTNNNSYLKLVFSVVHSFNFAPLLQHIPLEMKFRLLLSRIWKLFTKTDHERLRFYFLNLESVHIKPRFYIVYTEMVNSSFLTHILG